MDTFLVSGEQAGGNLFAREAVVPPGGGPPRHAHAREDEILEGSCSVRIGERELQASAPHERVDRPAAERRSGVRDQVHAPGAGAIALLLLLASSTALAGDLPGVEYVAVEGKGCLQPAVHRPGVKISDYRAAERRWLAEKYPGRPTPRWKTVIVIEPEGSPGRKRKVQRETAYVQQADGSVVEVCFDIGMVSER
jgi:hypothetical protein